MCYTTKTEYYKIIRLAKLALFFYAKTISYLTEKKTYIYWIKYFYNILYKNDIKIVYAVDQKFIKKKKKHFV